MLTQSQIEWIQKWIDVLTVRGNGEKHRSDKRITVSKQEAGASIFDNLPEGLTLRTYHTGRTSSKSSQTILSGGSSIKRQELARFIEQIKGLEQAKTTKPTRQPSGKIYDFEAYTGRRKRYPRRPVDPSKPPRVSKPREPLSLENETRSEEYARTLIAQENLASECWSEPMRPSAATPFDYVTINERTGRARWYEVKIEGRDGASEQQTTFMALMKRRGDETKIVEVKL